jgi:NAD(P)-dependent dehydrogenase (short-subunit alcohol dehydrogenase family)
VDAEPSLRKSVYAIAKRALNGWVRRSAPTAEWAGAGIPHNAVAPGVVDTPAAPWILTDDEVRNTIEAARPAASRLSGPPRVGRSPDQLAGRPENCIVTGQVIFAEGGAEAALAPAAASTYRSPMDQGRFLALAQPLFSVTIYW